MKLEKYLNEEDRKIKSIDINIEFSKDISQKDYKDVKQYIIKMFEKSWHPKHLNMTSIEIDIDSKYK